MKGRVRLIVKKNKIMKMAPNLMLSSILWSVMVWSGGDGRTTCESSA